MTAATKWILAIVGLLAANVLAMVILAVTATTGRSQVIPEYYAKAVAYDDTMDESTRSERLGWLAEATISKASIEVTVMDATSQPLAGARVHVTGYQRAHLADKIDVELADLGGGHYRGALLADRLGVHDLQIVVERAGARYSRRVTVESK